MFKFRGIMDQYFVNGKAKLMKDKMLLNVITVKNTFMLEIIQLAQQHMHNCVCPLNYRSEGN